ncbi:MULTISPECIES: TetR family transcriptional regulator [unclassified Streptomyces]|uniref:TetR family transcriptional regulator n=1 Tax=unclassified Streptomyces TaxID=2593676 RepID=UPI00352DC40C
MPEKQRTEEQAQAPRNAGAPQTAAPADPIGPTGPTGPTEEKPRRRQARGERRIAQLLEAAASVFCRSGYTAASTNAIAREAGVSPGTLYQFFPNKEAIAVGLSDQLLHDWRAMHGQALAPENIGLPLDAMLDAALDPMIAFNVENPAFAVLMHGTDTPGRIAEDISSLHDTVFTRVEEIVAGYLPDAPADELSRMANMVLALFKAGLTLILSHEGAERDAYIAELKAVMYRYLKPLVEDDCPAAR